MDKIKNNEPKTFAFVTFAREDSAKQLVKAGGSEINGHRVEIKKVTPKDGGAGGWGAPGFGGAAGGWGGYSDPYAYGGGYGGTSFIRLKKESKFSVSDRYPGPFILHFDPDTDPGLPEK